MSLKPFWRYVGTFVHLIPAVVGMAILSSDFANIWLRAGIAVLALNMSFRDLARSQLNDRIAPLVAFRITLIGYLLAGSLCGVGSILFGGPLGWLGVFLSLRFALLPARVIYRWSVPARATTAALDYERESQWVIALFVVVPLLAVFGLLASALWRR